MAKLPIAVPPRELPDRAFTWFAYGSTLDTAAFTAWCAQHGYALPSMDDARPGRLEGYRLSFDVMSRFWGGAVASLAEAPGRSVEGLLIPLPATSRTLVDHKEGAVSGLYEAFDVAVLPLAGGDRVSALAYRSAPSRRLAAEAAPSPTFVATLIAGARAAHLSAAYLEELQALKAGS